MKEIVIILIIAIICLGLIIWNLLKKVEILEEESINKDIFLSNIENLVKDSFEKIQNVETEYNLENDDEIGFIFKFHKEVIEILKDYFI